MHPGADAPGSLSYAYGMTADVITEVPPLAPRDPDANKGDFGRVLLVAGSRGMSGAAVLCASAALRGGAGLVRLALPAGILPIAAAGNPCYMTVPLPEDDQGRFAAAAAAEVVSLLGQNTSAGLGPGLGRGDGVSAVVRAVLERTTLPLVVDADGLNALPPMLGVLKRRRGPTVLTPHPGEFGRLIGADAAAVQANRQDLAVRFAAEHGVVLVLKGRGTIVTDGRRLYVNTTGNPGMAAGGTGDVLTGLTAALLGQKLEPFAAAQLAVYLHGLAGDLARDALGETSLIAADLLDYLPGAFLAHRH
ncbi:MAG TPA: NAD(P)H-hydrate dehydratase [Gemmataceae bacterium]|nr:NAD(P)H-hydrate dehydratase [Gemmataceae bacterium]